MIHALRVLLVVALLLAIPSPSATISSGDAVPPSIDRVRALVLAADAMAPGKTGRWVVNDDRGRPVAEIARTLPEAKEIVGYRGPTESLIVLDRDHKITAVAVLQSADTHEHVEAVINDTRFFEQFIGWDWHDPSTGESIDAVSGATLTSLALAEGVLKRMGADGGSLIFADVLTVSEVKDWFPGAHSIDIEAGFLSVKDHDGKTLGRVLRTGPYSDDVIGYQGPTELLMRVEEDDEVSSIRIRKSYDNEPYVTYVRDGKYSWSRLTGRTLPELATLDPFEERIEGVSGATMTSLAVADTVIAAAKQFGVEQAKQQVPDPTVWARVMDWFGSIRWSSRDAATIAVMCFTWVFSQMKWFRHQRLRRLWLLGIAIIIGWWAGNLVSLALVAGWSAEGIAWRLAPGLAAIAAVAILIPPLTKGNPYCNHLCPHGAVQQLIKPSRRSKRSVRLSGRWSKWLTKVPGATLVAAYLAIVMVPATDLSSWEPFHAYLFRIAGWGAIAVCGLTLVLAMFVPMGYCRLGCPTGRLIDYMRRTAKSDRIDFADGIAAVLLIVALATRMV